MYKRILVPVDGSTASEAALSKALAFALEQDAAVRLVHVCEPMQYIIMEGPVNLADAIRRQGKALLEAAKSRAEQAGVRAETSLLEPEDQRIPQAIVEEANRWKADLIAMGTHGRRGIEHLFIGSVAEGVVRRATVPVHLLRAA